MRGAVRRTAGAVAAFVVLAGCVGSDDDAEQPVPTPTATEAAGSPTDGPSDGATGGDGTDGSDGAEDAQPGQVDTSGNLDQSELLALLAESQRAPARAFEAGMAGRTLRSVLRSGAMIEEQDAFTSPGGATFTYRVQDRYDLWPAAWKEIRRVEVTTIEPHTESVKGYDPAYVHPDQWTVVLDGCATDAPDGGALTFAWTIERDGAVVAARDPATCEAPFGLPDDGRYDVTLQVRSDAGWQDTMTATVDVADLVILSLGDSAASGEGNPESSGSSVGWVDRRCHRSSWSGHARTAEALEARSDKSSVTFLSFACSGAEIDSGILGPYKGMEPRVWPMRSSDLWEFHPLDAQIDAAREALCAVPVSRCGPDDMRRVDLVLVSIGINDLSFSTILKACADLDFDDVDFTSFGMPAELVLEILEGPCHESAALDSGLHRKLQSLQSTFEPWAERVLPCTLSDEEWEERLGYVPDDPPPFCFDGHETYGELRRRLIGTGLWPRDGVYLSTYPANPFGSTAGGTTRGCEALSRINHDESRWLAEWGRRLDEAIHLEAIRNGFHSVSGTTDAFGRHGYCANERWFVQLSESMIEQRQVDGTMHPNRRGHEQIRDDLLATIAAAKPDRAPTHRATAIINRVRFDLPDDADYQAEMTFSFFPHERILTDEVGEGDWLGDGLESVTWKRGVVLAPPFEVTPGEWQVLPQPVRMQMDLTPSDVWLWFSASATVPGVDGSSLQRARPRAEPERTPDGEPLPVEDAPGGYYTVELDATRPPVDAGAGTWVLRSEQDFGGNEGWMTVDFCIVVSPIGSQQRPTRPGQQLGCPDVNTTDQP